jgi:hypothetical protein
MCGEIFSDTEKSTLVDRASYTIYPSKGNNLTRSESNWGQVGQRERETGRESNLIPTSDLQTTVLNYYLQELTSHGAIFLGFVAALFPFVNLAFPPHGEQKGSLRRVFASWLILTILLAGIIFVLVRLLLYGEFVSATLRLSPFNITALYYPRLPASNLTLYDYSEGIAVFAKSSFPLGPIITFFGGLFSLGAAFSLLVGGIVSQEITKSLWTGSEFGKLSKWRYLAFFVIFLVILVLTDTGLWASHLGYFQVDLVILTLSFLCLVVPVLFWLPFFIHRSAIERIVQRISKSFGRIWKANSP